MLNAFGGAFFFSMVSGADRDRLNLLLGLEYAVLALAALVAYLLSRHEGTADGPAAEAPALEVTTSR